MSDKRPVHMVFRVGFDPEVLTPPICGTTPSDDTEVTTHEKYATCDLCDRIVLATLFRVFGPDDKQKRLSNGMTHEMRHAEAADLRRLVRAHAAESASDPRSTPRDERSEVPVGDDVAQDDDLEEARRELQW